MRRIHTMWGVMRPQALQPRYGSLCCRDPWTINFLAPLILLSLSGSPLRANVPCISNEGASSGSPSKLALCCRLTSFNSSDTAWDRHSTSLWCLLSTFAPPRHPLSTAQIFVASGTDLMTQQFQFCHLGCQYHCLPLDFLGLFLGVATNWSAQFIISCIDGQTCKVGSSEKFTQRRTFVKSFASFHCRQVPKARRSLLGRRARWYAEGLCQSLISVIIGHLITTWSLACL